MLSSISSVTPSSPNLQVQCPHLCCLHKSVLFFYLPLLDFFTYLLICGPLSDAAGCVPPYPVHFFSITSPSSLSPSPSPPGRRIELKGGFSLVRECICICVCSCGFLPTEHSCVCFSHTDRFIAARCCLYWSLLFLSRSLSRDA